MPSRFIKDNACPESQIDTLKNVESGISVLCYFNLITICFRVVGYFKIQTIFHVISIYFNVLFKTPTIPTPAGPISTAANFDLAIEIKTLAICGVIQVNTKAILVHLVQDSRLVFHE